MPCPANTTGRVRGDLASASSSRSGLRTAESLAGMNVNVWDVHDDIKTLVTAGYSGTAVDPIKLADPEVSLGDLLTA